MEAELHAFVVAAKDVGDASEGGVGLAEYAAYGIDRSEHLVGIKEQTEVGAVHTYGAGLVQQSQRTLHGQCLGRGIEGVGAGGDGLTASSDAEGLVLIEGVGGSTLGDTNLAQVGAELLFDAGSCDFTTRFCQEVLALEAYLRLLIGPGADDGLFGHRASEQGAEQAVEDGGTGIAESGVCGAATENATKCRGAYAAAATEAEAGSKDECGKNVFFHCVMFKEL